MNRVRVEGVPPWLDATRLLGPSFAPQAGGWEADLSPPEAADVHARLRGLGFGGRALTVLVSPSLPRALVRSARTRDAQRRRETTPLWRGQGRLTDEEGRWSATPEALAVALARRFPARRVVDATAGIGQNTRAWAEAGAQVLAIELDPARAQLAQTNLSDLGTRVRLIVGDARAWLPKLQADLLFLDPPWGTDWPRAACRLPDLPLLPSLLACSDHFPSVVIKVPPSFDPASCPGFSPLAWFGLAPGDHQRVKFLTLHRSSV